MTSYADQVDLEDELSAEVHDHVHSDTENEVGGVLVGTLQDGAAEVRHVLPALEAVGGAAQLTFTHDVWEHLLSTVDRDFPDEQIVGWYHSHPGHGIFLSSFDQFIHENFFSAPGMVALVVDPRDDDAFGWFGWEDGTLTRLGSDLPVDRPDRAPVPREISVADDRRRSEERSMDTIRQGVLIALAVVVVFAMGMWARSGAVDEAEARAAAVTAETQGVVDLANERGRHLASICRSLRDGPTEADDDLVATTTAVCAEVFPTPSTPPSPEPTGTDSTPSEPEASPPSPGRSPSPSASASG